MEKAIGDAIVGARINWLEAPDLARSSIYLGRMDNMRTPCSARGHFTHGRFAASTSHALHMTTNQSPRASIARRRAPQPRPESEQTKDRILDSAEKLFARHGYHGTSIRDIASDADYQFALIGYHFGSKLELVDKVLARRSAVLNTERLAFLERARVASDGVPIPVRTLIEGYVGVIVRRASRNDQGWRNYTQLVGMLGSGAEWSELTDKHFNAVAREYLGELQRSLPEVPSESLYQAFFFLVGTMVTVCARPGRIETMSKGQFKSKEVSTLYENLCTFLEGGFAAIAGRSAG